MIQNLRSLSSRALAHTLSRTCVVALVSLSASLAFAAPAQKAAKPTFIEGDGSKAFGNGDATQGGTFNYNLGGEPTTLHPITGTDLYNQTIKDWVMSRLLARNPETNDWMPSLAEKAEIAADGMSYTFYIRKNAKFHDGKPVTAEDVKFSFDAIFEPKYNAAHMRPYYENFEKAEFIDQYTVKFTVKEKYFGNLDQLGSLDIVPKHIYGDVDKSKKLNKTLVGSGPYKVEAYNQGQNIILVRNKDWFGNAIANFKGMYNFERIRLRFIDSADIGVEMLKKGDLDLDGFGPETYMKKAEGPEWGKTVMKEKVENKTPKSYGYIGWNLKRDLFKDRDVRVALVHALNRDEMNKKFRFGMSQLATGPWYLQSEYADPGVKAIPFDLKKATDLFKKAGWADSDKDGTLDKTINGKKVNFNFTLNYVGKDIEKYLVLYQNDLKKVGVTMNLQTLEWNALLKNLDDGNFDAATLAWGGGEVDLDPKQIWHSSSMVKGGSNRISYSSPEVDKLIDQSRGELDKKKRIKILREVYHKIADDAPYAFLFNDRYALYGHSAKVKMTKGTFPYTIGYNYWWFDKAQ